MSGRCSCKLAFVCLRAVHSGHEKGPELLDPGPGASAFAAYFVPCRFTSHRREDRDAIRPPGLLSSRTASQHPEGEPSHRGAK